jgi:molybdate transport system regulatory protein
MEVKLKIWLEAEGRVLFGQGRMALLKTIDECHCLSTAAKKLNMSYRAAWGRLKASEKRLGMKLVEMQTHGEGSHLTAEAKTLLSNFELLEKETHSFLIDMSRKLSFPNGNKIFKNVPEKTVGKIVTWGNMSFFYIQSLHLLSHTLEYI